MKVRDTSALLTAFVTASLLCPLSGVDGSSSEGELVWIAGDNSINVEAGSPLELTCHAKISDPTNIVWVKINDEGSVIIAHDEKLLIVSDRISINHNSSEGISVLKIENSHSKDSGRYECQVPTMNSTINAAIEVIVKEGEDETLTAISSDHPTNTSLPDEEVSSLSKGHSVTFSVFLIPSIVFTCVLFNAIPAVTQC